MYLSRIALNVELRATMRALASPQILHGAVEGAFPRAPAGARSRKLWRLDMLNGRYYLLVLSAQQPDFSRLAAQFGCPDANRPWETKSYNPLLARLAAGQIWRFRLRANPVRSSFRDRKDTSGRSQVHAHVTQDQQKQWLLKRAQPHGFLLAEDAFDIVHTEWKRFRKSDGSGRLVTLRTAAFEGILTISDCERFRQALLCGIGRAKAYGCGLLTVAPLGEG